MIDAFTLVITSRGRPRMLWEKPWLIAATFQRKGKRVPRFPLLVLILYWEAGVQLEERN